MLPFLSPTNRVDAAFAGRLLDYAVGDGDIGAHGLVERVSRMMARKALPIVPSAAGGDSIRTAYWTVPNALKAS